MFEGPSGFLDMKYRTCLPWGHTYTLMHNGVHCFEVQGHMWMCYLLLPSSAHAPHHTQLLAQTSTPPGREYLAA